jgi:flagellar biosynthetic protein FliQ
MEAVDIMDISREAVWVFLKVSTPLMLVALGVGLIISLFQALTQIQENTLSFVPKVVTIFLFLLFYMPVIGNTLLVFSEHLTDRIITIGKS